MNLVAPLFLLLAGTAAQSLLPAVSWLGYATFPVLPAIVLYYALYRGRVMMLVVAMLAGLFQDSMSLIPLGYSTFVLAVSTLLVERYREVIQLRSAFTHMVLTAMLSAALTLLLMLLMLNDGSIAWHPWRLPLKVPGALLLGLLTGPVVIAAAYSLEEKLGLIQGERDSYGAQRSYFGLG